MEALLKQAGSRPKAQSVVHRMEGKLALKYPTFHDLEERIKVVHRKMQQMANKPKLIPKQNIKKLSLYERAKTK